MEGDSTGRAVDEMDRDDDESSSTTEVVSDFSDSSSSPKFEWVSSFASDLVNLRSPLFQPTLALRLSSDRDGGIVGRTSDIPDPSAPKYLNLTTYAKAVPNPSKKSNVKFQLKDGVASSLLDKKAKSDGGSVGITAAATTERMLPIKSPSVFISTPTNVQSSTPTTVGPGTPGTFPIPGRRFLPHQLPVYNPRPEMVDTVKIMATMEGPLGALRVAMEAKKRVKIWTRRDSGIRGYLTGFIEAFDKHWNLALRDVDEVFCRKKRSKSLVEMNMSESRTHERGQVLDPLVSQSQPPSHGTRSKDKTTTTPTLLALETPSRSPSKRSKRIAARSRSKSRRELLDVDNSEDLVNWCRSRMENLTLKDKPKSTKSRSFEKKHSITHFSQPWRDANGFVVVGVTRKAEIVERHVGQLFVMGNDIVMVETMR